MIYNNFFKDDENIKRKPNQKNDWLALKKNPWNIFSNYSNTIDKSLTKIYHFKNEYLDNLNKHKDIKNKIQTYQNEHSNSKLSFQDNAAIFCISLLFATIPFLLSEPTVQIFIYSLIAFFSTVILAKFLHTKEKNYYYSKTQEKMTDELNATESTLSNLEKEYKKEVKNLLKNREEFNIREELDKQYHTNISELNIIIQDILEKNYPKDNCLHITSNIEDDLEYFTVHSEITYSKKIYKVLNKIIDNKIFLDISNQMDENLNDYKLHNNQSPSTLIAVVNGN